MKPIPCKIIVNNWIGYCFTPQDFPSVRQAYKYGKKFMGGFAFRIFNLKTGKLMRNGYCDPDC